MRRIRKVGRVGKAIASGQINTNTKIGTITSTRAGTITKTRTGTIIVAIEITRLSITDRITIVIIVIKDSRLSRQALTHLVHRMTLQLKGKAPVLRTEEYKISFEINYSTVEKEMLAIILATKYFRPYLFGRKFQIVTDHRPLTWL